MAAAATMYGIKTTAAVLAFSSGAQLSGLRVAGTTTDSTTEKTTPACTSIAAAAAIETSHRPSGPWADGTAARIGDI